MMGFDLVVAVRAQDSVLSKGPEALCPVLFLQIDQFAGIAPALLVVRVIIVLNEAQRSAVVLDQVSAYRSKCRLPAMRAVDVSLIGHGVEGMHPASTDCS